VLITGAEKKEYIEEKINLAKNFIKYSENDRYKLFR